MTRKRITQPSVQAALGRAILAREGTHPCTGPDCTDSRHSRLLRGAVPPNGPTVQRYGVDTLAVLHADLDAATVADLASPELTEADAPLSSAQPVGPPGRKSRTRSTPEAEDAVAQLEGVLLEGVLPKHAGALEVAERRMPPGQLEVEILRRDPFQLPPEAAECDRYLGVDPGLANLGLFVLGLTPTSVRCLFRETFVTLPKQGTDEQRLALIARRLRGVVRYWRPTAVGHEDVRSITTGKEKAGAGNSDRGPLLMICGMLIEIAADLELPCYRIANQSARVAVLGKGKSGGATKATVRDRVQELTGTRKLTLDQGDAGAMAFGTFVKHRDRNVQVRLPKKRRTKP